MIIPSIAHFNFVKSVKYTDMTDLGRPYSSVSQFTGTGNVAAYRNNVWCMFLFGGKIHLGVGNSANTKPGDNVPAPWAIRAIDTLDDSVYVYPVTGMQAREISFFQEVDGSLFAPDIDSHNDASSYVYRLEDVEGTPTFIRYLVVSARNHSYFVHKSRRTGRWYFAHGVTSLGQNIFTSVANFEDLPRNYDSSAGANKGNSRGIAIMEFGPSESSRLIAITHSYGWRDYTTPYTATNDTKGPKNNEVEGSVKFLYEVTETPSVVYNGKTDYFVNGLSRKLTHPWYYQTSNGSIITDPTTGGAPVALQNVTRVDDDTYIAVIGRSPGNMPRVNFPGNMHYQDLGTDGIIDQIYHGGVYFVTLGTTKPIPQAYGDVFLQCERVLPDTELTGRQWNFQLVGSDIYILTETPDLRCHLYKNGKRILTMTDMPTFARSFCVVGSSLYLGLGSEEYDPYRRNGQTLNINSGRILKVSNFQD